MLRFPDFFKVAVASAGNHDQRGYSGGWGERYIGHAGSATTTTTGRNFAHRRSLRGKLLLVHGEMDDNVHPGLTLRLADALIAANKDFDLLIIPNAEHGLLAHRAYWLRRRWDYFVRICWARPPMYPVSRTSPSTPCVAHLPQWDARLRWRRDRRLR